ncbi:MAG: diaminopimelate epimerase [Burkholderiales bacterium]
MRIGFTKMQGAGNDFVVLDETAQGLNLGAAQYRWLADRHFGIGADQILSVRPASTSDVDFDYVIHNADGGQVEHCGNGARCFARFVQQRGLTTKSTLRVRVQNGVITLQTESDGRVTVDMGAPVFDLARIPFDPGAASGQMQPATTDSWKIWPLALSGTASDAIVNVAILSMGNPHAVTWVAEVDSAPVATQGPQIGQHPAFPRGVNVGFAQVVDRSHIRLRVFERGAGETLSCGTGACAAVVAGIRLGLLDPAVDVATRGGHLTIRWSGNADESVRMTGPAVTVFEGSVDLPTL